MRVWVDLTNSPHVLVLRPLIELLRAEGHEVSVTARDFSQTLELCDRFGIDHTAIGRHRGERIGSKAIGLDLPLAGADPLGPPPAPARGAAVRPRPRARLQRHQRGGRGAADPQRDDVRLRVGDGPALDQLPPRPRGGGARGDPPRAPGPLRRHPQAAPLRGAQGGVLPERLRARRGGAAPARASTASARWSWSAHRRSCPSTTASRTTSSPPCWSASTPPPRPASCSAWCCRGRPPSARPWREMRGLLVPDHVDRRPVAVRLRRRGGLGRRDHEPRGRGPRHARLHDLRGPHGGRRRTPHRRGPPAPAHERRGARPRAAARARPPRHGCAGTPACCSNSRLARSRPSGVAPRSLPSRSPSGRTIPCDAPTYPFGGPHRSTDTRSRSWLSMECSSGSRTTSPSSCASTAGPPRYYAHLREDTIWWVIALSVVVLVLFRVYQRRYRFAGQRDYETLVRAVIVIVLLTAVAIEVLRPVDRYPHRSTVAVVLPNGVIVLFFAARGRVPGRPAGGRPQHLRAPARWPPSAASARGQRSVLIAGAGEGGRMVVREIMRNRELGLAPVGFLDDDPAQARPAHRRRARARRHREGPAPHPRRGRTRRSDHRDPLRARLDARADRARVPHAGDPGADAADAVRAAADPRRARPAGARGARRGRARPRAGAHGARARGRLPRRAGRARDRRRRLDRLASCAARSPASSPTASCSSTTPRTTSSRSSASSRTSATCRPRCWRRCWPTARRRSACAR